MKLYQINDAIEVILAMQEVDSETGELLSDIPDAAYEALDELEIERKEKVLSVAKYILGEFSEGKAIRERIKEMTKRAASHENRGNDLLGYLQMQTQPSEKFEDADVLVRWQKSSHVEVSVPAEELSDQFQRIKITVEADKKKIRDALREGEEVDGCWIQPTQKVVIR